MRFPSPARQKQCHSLLLTGTPGIGKTTVLRKVAEQLAGRRLAGFYTEEIRQQGQRQGFRLVTLTGQTAVIAQVDFPKTYRVGRYGVAVAAIDALVTDALAIDPAVEVYLVDEIGKMECLSAGFITAMQQLLATEKQVIATIARHGTGFITAIKQRPDAELWEVTHANRDTLPQAVVGWLSRLT